MPPDWLLLRRYAQENSQEAFATLTQRYVNLVYSVCLHEVHDADLAQDVTQAVFLLLARVAPTFRSRTALPGWLFRTARFTAQNARTRELRRAAYELKAVQVMRQQDEQKESAVWADIEPILNKSLAALREGERQCVLLRFFQEMSFIEVGASLGLSEEAARKRVTRALEKMHHFFTKEGIVVPGVTLAALLSSHAAKAAPATCQAVLAHISNTVLAGQVPLGLIGSHVYQIAEGALKAMKIVQIKAVVGIYGVIVFGCSVCAFAIGEISNHFMPIGSLPAVPKPGHILIQPPGKILTAAQIAARCREACAALSSYQGTSTVTTLYVSSQFPVVTETHTSSNILFVRPGQIHVEGKMSDGRAFAYISDGRQTSETFPGLNHWTKDQNIEDAVDGMSGVSSGAGTDIPAMLLGTQRTNPWTYPKLTDAEIREDNAEGQPCYVLTTHPITPWETRTEYLWIDEKTFLLRRYFSEDKGSAHTNEYKGKPVSIPAEQSQSNEQFTNIRLNAPIPESAFTLPPTS